MRVKITFSIKSTAKRRKKKKILLWRKSISMHCRPCRSPKQTDPGDLLKREVISTYSRLKKLFPRRLHHWLDVMFSILISLVKWNCRRNILLIEKLHTELLQNREKNTKGNRNHLSKMLSWFTLHSQVQLKRDIFGTRRTKSITLSFEY